MQLNINIQFCTTSADLVRNIFLKQPFSSNSSDLNCLLLIGHASRPYNSTLTFNFQPYPTCNAFDARVMGGGFPSEYWNAVWYGKTRMAWYTRRWKKFEDMFICFDGIHERERRTDTHTQTDTAWRHRPLLHSIARQKLTCRSSLVYYTTRNQTENLVEQRNRYDIGIDILLRSLKIFLILKIGIRTLIDMIIKLWKTKQLVFISRILVSLGLICLSP